MPPTTAIGIPQDCGNEHHLLYVDNWICLSNGISTIDLIRNQNNLNQKYPFKEINVTSDELDFSGTFHSSKESLDVVPDQVSTLIVLELEHTINVLAVQVLFKLALHVGIPEVLDGVAGPAGKALGDISPTVYRAILL